MGYLTSAESVINGPPSRCEKDWDPQYLARSRIRPKSNAEWYRMGIDPFEGDIGMPFTPRQNQILQMHPSEESPLAGIEG